MTKPLQSLAQDFLGANLPLERARIREAVQTEMDSIECDSYSGILKSIGISYLASVNSSQKLEKGRKLEFDTLGLYLAPANRSGRNVCSFAGVCQAPCLVDSGHALLEERAGKSTISRARLIKTWLHEFRPGLFGFAIVHEIKRAEKAARKKRRKFCVRLNCTSDLDFSDIHLQFPTIQFYDYTKNPHRMESANYHLTYSWDSFAPGRLHFYRQALARGQKIAFPIAKCDMERALALPDTLEMDSSDLRFLDGPGKYGLLSIKETGAEKTIEGLQKGFFLDFDGLVKAIKWIEGGNA